MTLDELMELYTFDPNHFSNEQWETMIEEAHNAKPVSSKPESCSCGAKHTSNPKHHLKYCDLNKN